MRRNKTDLSKDERHGIQGRTALRRARARALHAGEGGEAMMAKREVLAPAALFGSRRVKSLLFRAILLVGLFRELCSAEGTHDELYRSVYAGGKIMLAEDAVQVTSTWFENNPFQPPGTEHTAEGMSEVECTHPFL